MNAHIPLIVYNGALVIDHGTGKIMLSNFFGPEIRDVLCELFACEIFPIVYSFVDSVEKYSYIPDKCTWGMQDYIDSRKPAAAPPTGPWRPAPAAAAPARSALPRM